MAKTTTNKLELTIFRKERTPKKGKPFDTYFATKNDGTDFIIDGEPSGATVNVKFWDEPLEDLQGDKEDAEFPVGLVLTEDIDYYLTSKRADNAMGVSCVYYTIHIKSFTEIVDPVIKKISVK